MASLNKTCTTCRSRKVRCDGIAPICGPCSKARRPLECAYDNSSKSTGVKAALLHKGAACYPCRRKKKRCDARRPCCSTCKTAGKENDCQYEETVQRNLTEALLARTRELEQRLAEYERGDTGMIAQEDIVTSVISSSSREASPITSMGKLNEFLAALIDTSNSPTYETSMERQMSPEIPSSLPVTSFAGPSRRITEVPFKSASEIISPLLSMYHLASPLTLQTFDEFRMIFLAHHAQLGISLPERKVRAIMSGDISGSVVDPVFIYTAQLVGCRLWQEQRHTYTCNPIEAMQLEAVRQTLAVTSSPVSRLQIHCNLAVYFLLKREMCEGRDHILQASQVISLHNLHFHPDYAEGILETNDDIQERICAMSQFVYLDKDASIVLNDPTLLSVELDEQFKALPTVFPVMSRNVVVLRARSIALLQSARCLSSKWTDMVFNTSASSASNASSVQTDWYGEYWALMEDILSHISVLSQTMLKSTFFLDREFGLGMKLCLMISLTASVEMHQLLASYHLESRQKCLDAVFEIIGIVKWLKDDDYIFLDPILGKCWSVVAHVLHQERNTPTDEATTLHYRSLLSVIVSSSAKLGRTLPFVESSANDIHATVSAEAGLGSR